MLRGSTYATKTEVNNPGVTALSGTNPQLQEEINLLTVSLQGLDLKRIRAVCEPSIKNENTGETWLEYYNSQIFEKREQLQELQERIRELNDISE